MEKDGSILSGEHHFSTKTGLCAGAKVCFDLLFESVSFYAPPRFLCFFNYVGGSAHEGQKKVRGSWS